MGIITIIAVINIVHGAVAGRILGWVSGRTHNIFNRAVAKLLCAHASKREALCWTMWRRRWSSA